MRWSSLRGLVGHDSDVSFCELHNGDGLLHTEQLMGHYMLLHAEQSQRWS